MMIPTDDLPSLGEEYDGLAVFVVGGFVRDYFREDATPKDVDLMVAEVDAEEMRKRGFSPVNAHEGTFAVFLDSLGREVAIAREEESTGEGHTAFDVEAVPPNVPAEEAVDRDLIRRDFTVNSMAVRMSDGQLIDPHGGRDDLDKRIIRATDPTSFKHDPLRILRGARFASRLEADVAGSTKELMRETASSIEELPGERIRLELEKTFTEASRPRTFFECLNEVGALSTAFPELAALEGVPAGPEEWHKEEDALEHTLMVIEVMNNRNPNDELALLMAMVHDFGKASTPEEKWPSHHGHAKEGVIPIQQMNHRLRFSNRQRRAMEDASRLHMKMHIVGQMNSSTVFDLVAETHYPDRLIDLAIADKKGRIPSIDDEIADRKERTLQERFGAAQQAMREVTGQTLIDRGRDPQEMGGEKFGKHLRDARIARMKQIEGNNE